MKMPKKGYEIDERAWDLINECVLDLGKFFPQPQDVNMFKKQAKAALERVRVEIREKVLVDGRTDSGNTAADAGK